MKESSLLRIHIFMIEQVQFSGNIGYQTSQIVIKFS